MTKTEKLDFVNCLVTWGETSQGIIDPRDIVAPSQNDVFVTIVADCVHEEDTVRMTQDVFKRFLEVTGVQHSGRHMIDGSVLANFGFHKSADEGC